MHNADLVSLSRVSRLKQLLGRKTHKIRKLLVQTRVDEDARCQHRACADHVLLRFDGVRLVVQQITDNGPGHLTRRRVKLELSTLGIGTQLEELVDVVWLRQIAQNRGRAGPLNVFAVWLVPVTGMLENSLPVDLYASRRTFLTSWWRMDWSKVVRLVRKSVSALWYNSSHSLSLKSVDLSSPGSCRGVQQVQWLPMPPTTRVAAAVGRLSQDSWSGFWPLWMNCSGLSGCQGVFHTACWGSHLLGFPRDGLGIDIYLAVDRHREDTQLALRQSFN
jgi:hypothetical protein